MCIGLKADRVLVHFDELRIASILMLDYIHFDLFRIRYSIIKYHIRLQKMKIKVNSPYLFEKINAPLFTTKFLFVSIAYSSVSLWLLTFLPLYITIDTLWKEQYRV